MKKFKLTKKNMLPIFLLTLFALFISFWIYKSRNLQDSYTTNMKIQLGEMISNLRSSTHQLTNIINEPKYELTSHTLYQFYPTDLEKKSQAMVIKLNKDSDNVYITKRKKIKDSLMLVRYSLSNYKMALTEITRQNYPEAKHYLKKVDFYLEKAEREISLKTAEKSLIHKPL